MLASIQNYSMPLRVVIESEGIFLPVLSILSLSEEYNKGKQGMWLIGGMLVVNTRFRFTFYSWVL